MSIDRNMQQNLLEVQQVFKTVHDASGELSILHDISFSVSPGESLAVVGASGSGKSTLLAIMAGLDHPSSGEVRLKGEPFSTLSEDERALKRAQHIGFVFQNFQLIEHLSALENVMLALELQAITSVQAIRRRAEQALHRVGLASRLHHYPRFMSGGEQQRAALARAFVVEPQILMADEPTGSLDHASGARIMELLFDLNSEYKTALILVTHDPALSSRCGRSMRIEGGKIIA